jgi:hypothetical protein
MDTGLLHKLLTMEFSTNLIKVLAYFFRNQNSEFL